MKKILIVEDDLLQVLFLKKALTLLGHEIVGSTAEGTTAIEIANEMHPDIILMDIHLGGELNGIEAASQILKDIDCFVIYITGNSDENHINQAKLTQPSAILSKPITSEIIKNTIDSHYD